MAILTDIKSTNWQIGISGSGSVVEGLEDVRQCLDVLLRTQKGTDPLRPEFGSDIYQHIDKPVNAVIPIVKRAIISAVEMFEKRVEIVSVKHQTDYNNIQFFITYKLVDSDIIDRLHLYISDSGFITAPVIPGRLILEAIIPVNGSFQLLVDFITNGSEALPLPPAFGFANESIMFAWIQANWGSYGTWYLLPGKLVVYLNSNITTASLSITTSTMYRYSSPILNLAIGQSYALIFTQDATIGLGVYTLVSPLMSELLDFAIETYGTHGTWVIESYDGAGDFEVVDFDEDDFNVNLFYQLVLYSPSLNNASIAVTAG